MSTISKALPLCILADVCIFTGNHFIERGFVEIEGSAIRKVGVGSCPETVSSTKIISKPGFTLLPGLIDAHTHALKGNVLAIEQPLRFGVTTVCDMHNEAHHIVELKKLASNRENRGRYSDFKCAGTGAIIRGGWPEPVVKLHGETPEESSPRLLRHPPSFRRQRLTKAMINSWPKLEDSSEAKAFVEQQISESGAEYIKLFHELGDCLRLPVSLPRPPLELQKAIIEAAHEKGLIAVGHAFSYAGAIDLLECGVDGLTHIFLDKPKSNDYIDLCLRNKTYVNPTLSTCASQTRMGEDMQRAFAAEPLAQKALFDPTPRMQLGMAADDTSIENAYECTRALHKAGVPVIVGSDSSGQARGTAYGLGVHMEMHLLVHECGLEVEDVLKAATSRIADTFGFNDRGRIEVGRKADLVLVEGDVREVFSDRKNLCLPVRGVWRDGILADFYKA